MIPQAACRTGIPSAKRLRVSVNVSGSGDVDYYGDPELRKSLSGSAKVRRFGPSPQ
jgi:hypothetical protein